MDTKLARKLGFFDIYLFSLGYIIGAGLFILINKTVKYSKEYTWLAFLFAGVISILNVITYIEFSSVFQKNSGEYDYISSTLGNNMGLFVAILVIFIYILTNTTTALSFGEYINSITGYNKTAISALCIIIFSIINIIGIKMSSNVNIFITFLEITAILGIIIFGFIYILKNKSYIIPTNINSITSINKNANFNLSNISYATFIAMFAYGGFETTVKLIEEAKNPEKDIPIALGASIISAILLYTLVTFVITRIYNFKNINSSYTPLADIAKTLFGSSMYYIYIVIGSISILSSILISTLGGSRLLHGISDKYDYLKFLNPVDKNTNTPIISIVFISLISILLLVINNVENAVAYTSYLFFIVLTLLNISLILLHYDENYKDKLNLSMVGGLNSKFPITPVLALFVNISMLIFSYKFKITKILK
jgi:amino acid transporter